MLHLKSHCHTQSHLDSPYVFSQGFIVFCFTFRSMIHFELIFVKGVKSVSKFIFFKCGCQIVEKTIIPPLYCFRIFIKDHLTIFIWIYIWVPHSILLIYLFILSPILHCFDYYIFIVSLKVWVFYLFS